MKLKTLQIADDLQERITYSSHFLPLSVCIDNFDDYYQREWQRKTLCKWFIHSHRVFLFPVHLA